MTDKAPQLQAAWWTVILRSYLFFGDPWGAFSVRAVPSLLGSHGAARSGRRVRRVRWRGLAVRHRREHTVGRLVEERLRVALAGPNGATLDGHHAEAHLLMQHVGPTSLGLQAREHVLVAADHDLVLARSAS